MKKLNELSISEILSMNHEDFMRLCREDTKESNKLLEETREMIRRYEK